VVWFSGTVTSFKGGVDLWKIIYEDQDQEQVDSAELWNILLESPNFPAAGQPQQFCEPGDGFAFSCVNSACVVENRVDSNLFRIGWDSRHPTQRVSSRHKQ